MGRASQLLRGRPRRMGKFRHIYEGTKVHPLGKGTSRSSTRLQATTAKDDGCRRSGSRPEGST